jgi:hypothetical protein
MCLSVKSRHEFFTLFVYYLVFQRNFVVIVYQR